MFVATVEAVDFLAVEAGVLRVRVVEVMRLSVVTWRGLVVLVK
jgi:hypothetical protein